MPFEFQEDQQFRILAGLPGGEPQWYRVTGAVCDCFGIFWFDDQTGSGWSVTHLPSGRRVFVAITESAARAIVARLLAADVDWHQPQFSESETNRITALIRWQLLPEFVVNGWIGQGVLQPKDDDA